MPPRTRSGLAPPSKGKGGRRKKSVRHARKAAASAAAAVGLPTAEPPAPDRDDAGGTPPPSPAPKEEHHRRSRRVTAPAGESVDTPGGWDMPPPPPPDEAFRKLTRSNGTDMRKRNLLKDTSPTYRRILQLGDPSDEPAKREQHKKSTLAFLGSRAPVGLQNEVRRGTMAKSKIEKWMLMDTFYHTVEGGAENSNSEIEEKGKFYLDYPRLRDTMVPSRHIGKREKKDGHTKPTCNEFPVPLKIPAGGAPLFPPSFGEGRLQRDDYGPYYKSGRKGWRVEGDSDESHLIRLGDYLNATDFNRAYQLCGGNHLNYLGVLLMLCHAKYSRHETNNTKEIVYDDLDAELVIIESVCHKVEKIFEEGVKTLPGRPIRSTWGQWNVFNPWDDKGFPKPVQEWRNANRRKAVKDKGIHPDHEESEFEKLALLHYFIIMLGSASIGDERGEQAYYRVVNGRHDCLSFLTPLATRPFQALFEHYEELYRSAGKQRLSAHVLLRFLIPLYVLDNGEVPRKVRIANSYPDMGDKKTRIAWNGYGVYRGVGADVHTLRFLGCFIGKRKAQNRAQRRKRAQYLAGRISVEAGLNLNDIVGDLTQQYQRKSGNAWAREQINLLAEQSEDFRKVRCHWIGVLNGRKETEYYLTS